MIAGIGIDNVDIRKGLYLNQHSKSKLLTIFAEEEITYCRSHASKIAERFSSHFATKEAFFKAFSYLQPTHNFSLRAISQHITLKHTQHKVPYLAADWDRLITQKASEKLIIHLSITHCLSIATAIVIIERIFRFDK